MFQGINLLDQSVCEQNGSPFNGNKTFTPPGYNGIMGNPSFDPSGRSGQLHIHKHDNGLTISLHQSGKAVAKTTIPNK